MNTTTHPVAPDEIMAWLDGELPISEARTIATHLDECAECAAVAAQFRATPQSLSNWTVPPVPSRLEDSITELARRKSSGQSLPKQKLFTRPSFWTWKQWTLGTGCATIVLLLAIRLSIPRPSYQMAKPMMMNSINPQGESQSIDGQSIADQRSIPLNGRAEHMDSLTSSASSVAGAYGYSAGALQTPPPIAGKAQSGPHARAVSTATPAPMIARTASLTVIVKDISAARSSFDAIIARHRGYSAQITFDLSEGASSRGIAASLRVPASELPSALAELRALGRVDHEKQSGEEVTQQHVDLAARLQNSRETEQRLRDILAQRTGKIEDVLQVEEEIARVRGEIESMEADQMALEHRVDFATIDLELVEEYKAQFNSPASSASTRIHNAFVAGLDNAAATLLGFVLFFEEDGPVILIWLAILGLPCLFVWRRYRKARSEL